MRKLFVILLLILFPVASQAETLGYITDFHIGKEKVKKSENGLTIYPKLAKRCFNSSLKQAKSEGIGTMIIGGDVGKKKDWRYIERQARKYGISLIEVNGNHDKRSKNYFLLDRGDYQIIVLDSNQVGNIAGAGGIDEEQKNWLMNNLGKPTLIAMHHSVFNKHDNMRFLSEYDFLKGLPNVKLVITGHNHIEHSEKIGDTLFFTANPLTGNKHVNFYQIENFSVF